MAEQKFEDALNKLEQIVEDLESGSLNLDDAIKKYEEGMKLSAFCGNKLNEIKKKIEILVKDANGKISAKDFIEDELEDRPAAAKQKSTGKNKRPKGEGLLF